MGSLRKRKDSYGNICWKASSKDSAMRMLLKYILQQMHRDGKVMELAAYRVRWEAFHISFSFSTDNTRFTQEKQLHVKFQN